MPIPFTCPHCGVTTEVADEYAGQTGPCASCGKTITVPPIGGRMGRASAEHCGLTLVFVGFALAALVAMLLVAPAFQGVRKGRRSPCSNNLKQIGLALHMYHDEWKCLPPAYVADEQGRPMHSWRVLILPYVEQQALYEQYDFDQPWDSPHNLEVARQMPNVFHCPKDQQTGPADTSYVMPVGPGALCDGATPTTFADVTDGTSNTLAVVEMSDSGILWTEPQDLDVAAMTFTINAPGGVGLRSAHPGGANVLLLDASVRYLSEQIPAEYLHALVTRAGGEPTNEIDF